MKKGNARGVRCFPLPLQFSQNARNSNKQGYAPSEDSTVRKLRIKAHFSVPTGRAKNMFRLQTRSTSWPKEPTHQHPAIELLLANISTNVSWCIQVNSEIFWSINQRIPFTCDTPAPLSASLDQHQAQTEHTKQWTKTPAVSRKRPCVTPNAAAGGKGTGTATTAVSVAQSVLLTSCSHQGMMKYYPLFWSHINSPLCSCWEAWTSRATGDREAMCGWAAGPQLLAHSHIFQQIYLKQ